MGELATPSVPIGEQPSELNSVILPIDGRPAGKHFLYMEQLNAEDIFKYLAESFEAERLINDSEKRGIDLLPRIVLKAVMRQPSTRTGGSMTTAMRKLGGAAELISGMGSSSEAKGETIEDSWIAFAAQSDMLGIRTEEEWGPAYAALAIEQAYWDRKLPQVVPVVNLGDGRWQHPTQAIGDLYTIQKRFDGQLSGLKLAVVGDHERYRAHHSLMIGAACVGMDIMTVESPVAPVPETLINTLGPRLVNRGVAMDEAMSAADVLYMGRNPDEYTGKDENEIHRSDELADAYERWRMTSQRLQQMAPESIVMHPRPRRDELSSDADSNPRMADIEQMANMIPARMAIIALQAGKSIIGASESG